MQENLRVVIKLKNGRFALVNREKIREVQESKTQEDLIERLEQDGDLEIVAIDERCFYELRA